jgi:hypothetical protein
MAPKKPESFFGKLFSCGKKKIVYEGAEDDIFLDQEENPFSAKQTLTKSQSQSRDKERERSNNSNS